MTENVKETRFSVIFPGPSGFRRFDSGHHLGFAFSDEGEFFAVNEDLRLRWRYAGQIGGSAAGR